MSEKINNNSNNNSNDDVNYSIYISGVGGQGIIKTSVIIGEAAMLEGYDVVMRQFQIIHCRGIQSRFDSCFRTY